MSEKGRILDEIPLEISENRVQKVCFGGEGPPDLLLVALREPASSVGDLFGTLEEGDCFKRGQGRGEGEVRESPGQG